MKLSIIIPTYNSAATLSSTLDSVIGQGQEEIECWIVDGGSSDQTMEIVKQYAVVNPSIQYSSESDKGIYDAMNKGIRLAKGEYLYFMGSDDVFCHHQVLGSLFAEPAFGDADFIYGDIIFKHSGIRQGEEKTYLKLIKNLENINHQSIFYSRKVFSVIGNYDLKFPIYADFHFNIRCFRDNSLTKKYISQPVCIFNEKGTSFFHRNRDRYIESVHELYVNEYEDPVALYDTARQLEARLAAVLGSKEYATGKKIGNALRRIRKVFGYLLLTGVLQIW